MRTLASAALLLTLARAACAEDDPARTHLRAWFEAKDPTARKAAEAELSKLSVPADAVARAGLLRAARVVRSVDPGRRLLETFPVAGLPSDCYLATPKTGAGARPLVVSLHGCGLSLHDGLRPFAIPDEEWEDARKEIEEQLKKQGRAHLLGNVKRPAPFVECDESLVAAPQWLPRDLKSETQVKAELGEEAALRAVEVAIRDYGVDPDRVVLAGFSRGGWASLHTAVRHPDRFAGVLAVCCAATTEDPFENLARLPVYYVRGEKDDRISNEDADAVKAAFVRGKVPHVFRPIADLAHAFPRRDEAAKVREWIRERARDPWPREIDHRFVPETTRRRVFWVEVPEGAAVRVQARVAGNEITLSVSPPVEVVLHLGEPLLDLARDVVVKVGDRVVHKGKLQRSWTELLADVEASGWDFPRAAPARLTVRAGS